MFPMSKSHKLSIFHGKRWPLYKPGEPLTFDRIFEHTVKSMQSLNNGEEVSPIHDIKLQPGNPVVYYKDRIIPVAQLNNEANQLARAILDKYPSIHCNRDGDTLIILEMPRCPELVAAMFAVWKLKAAIVIVDESFPDQRVQHILNDSQPALIISNYITKDRYPGTHPTVSYTDLKSNAVQMSVENLPPETIWGGNVPEFDRVMAVVYTSGSSGTPKGVRVLHRNILTRIKWEFVNFPYSEDEQVGLFKQNPTFLDWGPELLCPLISGKSLVILTPLQVADVNEFINICEKFKFERIMMVPTYMQSLLHCLERSTKLHSTDQVKIRRMPDLKICFSTSETLHVCLARKFYEYFPEDEVTLFNFFGATEMTSDVLMYKVEGVKLLDSSIPIGGQVFDNTIVYLLDDNLRPVLDGEMGELCASGLNISGGYVGKKRDQLKFMDNPFSTDPDHCTIYRTGDYARYVGGAVYHEGRKDSLIKIRGHRVDISEVDAAVGKVKDVDKFCTLCYKAGEPEQSLLAFVTTKQTSVDAQVIEEELGEALPSYMVPSVIIVTDIPVLVSNKVDRQKLLKQHHENRIKEADTKKDFDFSGIPSENHEKAKALFETLVTCLGDNLKGNLNGTTNFFKIGGSSLNTILTVSKLSDIGYIIPIEDFINARNLSEIISAMRKFNVTEAFSLFDLAEMHNRTGYNYEPVKEEHKGVIIKIISQAFSKKSDLEKYFPEEEVIVDDYVNIINLWWAVMLEDNISFVTKNSKNEIVAATINVDFFNCPSYEHVVRGRASLIIHEFLSYLEEPFSCSDLFQNAEKIFYCFMGATTADLSPMENIEVFIHIEETIVKLAQERGYKAIFAVNVSPITQQLAVDVFGHTILRDYQVNKFEASDGSRPFEAAPNSSRAVVTWKQLQQST